MGSILGVGFNQYFAIDSLEPKKRCHGNEQGDVNIEVMGQVVKQVRYKGDQLKWLVLRAFSAIFRRLGDLTKDTPVATFVQQRMESTTLNSAVSLHSRKLVWGLRD